MARTLFFLTLLLFIPSALTVAQGKDVDLEKAQKALKDNLIKNAPAVSSVRFERCRALITLSLPGGGTFTGSGGNEPGGGFPRDEASASLSNGTKGEFIRTDVYEHFEIDLSRINPRNITLTPAYRKGLSRVDLADTGEKDAIFTRHKDKLEPHPVFTFFVKEKGAEESVKALQDAINLCESQGH